MNADQADAQDENPSDPTNQRSSASHKLKQHSAWPSGIVGVSSAPQKLPLAQENHFLKEIKRPHSATVGHVFWAISGNQRAG